MSIRKSFYHTRVQMYYDDLTSLPEDCVIAFLPRRGIYMLKILMRYASRRINWVQEVISETDFLAPDDENWDTIQAIVSETEGRLMSACDIAPIVEALQCICESLRLELGNSIAPLATMRDEDVEKAFEYSKFMPDADLSGLIDEEACQVAQLFYALGYETITEIVLPVSMYAFDTLAPAVAALIIGITGGIALPAILGVYLCTEMIQELLETGYKASESNLINWMLSVKDEMICTSYFALKSGCTAKEAAQAVYDNVVAPSSSISYGDKLICKLFFSGWTVTNADIARSENTPWAQENIEASYCTTCDNPDLPAFLESYSPRLVTAIAEGKVSVEHQTPQRLLVTFAWPEYDPGVDLGIDLNSKATQWDEVGVTSWAFDDQKPYPSEHGENSGYDDPWVAKIKNIDQVWTPLQDMAHTVEAVFTFTSDQVERFNIWEARKNSSPAGPGQFYIEITSAVAAT